MSGDSIQCPSEILVNYVFIDFEIGNYVWLCISHSALMRHELSVHRWHDQVRTLWHWRLPACPRSIVSLMHFGVLQLVAWSIDGEFDVSTARKAVKWSRERCCVKVRFATESWEPSKTFQSAQYHTPLSMYICVRHSWATVTCKLGPRKPSIPGFGRR